MGDDGFYRLNDYGIQLQRPKKIDLETKTVILTKGSRDIDIHEIDDVIINHEPTTYDTKKEIFDCRYCGRMYQSPIWLSQHESECDLRADSKFKKIINKKQHPSANSIENQTEENSSPENESSIELEPSSPIFFMPTHNHIDAYQTNHPSNGDPCNNEHQIYPHEEETYENNPIVDPTIDTNEIILEPMDSQPVETTEASTSTPMQTSPPSSDNQLSSTPINIKENIDNDDQEENILVDVDVPKLEPIAIATNELKDDEDSIVIYQDHQDSQETISSDDDKEMSLDQQQNCGNEDLVPSNISEVEETDSEDDSEYETFSETIDNELNNKINLLKAQFKDKEIQLIKDQNKIYVKILLTENVTKCFLLQD